MERELRETRRKRETDEFGGQGEGDAGVSASTATAPRVDTLRQHRYRTLPDHVTDTRDVIRVKRLRLDYKYSHLRGYRLTDSLYLSLALSAASFIPLAALALRSLALSIMPVMLVPPILNMEEFMPLNMDEFIAPNPPLLPPLPVR